MEILVVVVVMMVIMLIAARFDDGAGSSGRTDHGNERNHSSMDDDWSTDPTQSFLLGNIWHNDD